MLRGIPPEMGPTGGNEVWRRLDGPALEGLRRLEESCVFRDGRFFGRERFGIVGELCEGGDAMVGAGMI